jgi:membrane protease YdiL (CAAX protease family)
VVITYVFNKTGGSVWAGILIHGGTNVWSKALSGPVNPLVGEDLRSILVVVIALLILALTRTELGRRS